MVLSDMELDGEFLVMKKFVGHFAVVACVSRKHWSRCGSFLAFLCYWWKQIYQRFQSNGCSLQHFHLFNSTHEVMAPPKVPEKIKTNDLFALYRNLSKNGTGNWTKTGTENWTNTMGNNGSWFLSLSQTRVNFSVQFIWSHWSQSRSLYLSRSRSCSCAVWMNQKPVFQSKRRLYKSPITQSVVSSKTKNNRQYETVHHAAFIL